MSWKIRQRSTVVLTGAVLALALSGCGGGSVEPGATGSTPPQASASVPGGPLGSAAPATETTVTRTGGYAGVTQTLVVHTDGRWEYRDGPDARPASGRLPDDVARELWGLLADPALATVTGPTPAGQCADGFKYRLSTGARTVEWQECGGVGPEVAQGVVQLLARETGL